MCPGNRKNGSYFKGKRHRKIPNLRKTMDAHPILVKAVPNQASHLLFCCWAFQDLARHLSKSTGRVSPQDLNGRKKPGLKTKKHASSRSNTRIAESAARRPLSKRGQYLPLHVNGRSKNFGCFRRTLAYGSHDIFSFRLQLVHKVVHLLPLSAKFQGFTGT